MPHATEKAEQVVNGSQPNSQFISHLTSLPVVNDSIETFKSNQYGKKSLELIDGAYDRFGKPVQPYLETPYSYAKPYVQKADELADKGLTTVEEKFPIVKEDTHTIVDTAKDYAFWPLIYVTNTWQDEYKKTAKYNNRGPGVVTGVRAIVSTELRIAADFLHAVAGYLGPKYEESKKKGSDYAKQAEDTASEYLQAGKEKAGELHKAGKDKAGELQKAGEEKKEDVKKDASKTKDDVQKKAGEVKDDVNKKTSK